MRFKKGSKVEVLNSNKFPSGAWQRAVIVSRNGHSYTVKYDCSSLAESIFHNVLKTAIRPLPPPLSCVEHCADGDVVEVFDDNSSWKIATILKVMSGNFYLIRLLGSSKQFKVHKVNVRVRQCWQDGDWVLIGKGSGSSEVTKSYRVLIGDDRLAVQNSNFGFQESYNVSARTLKRGASPCYSSSAESWTGNAQKEITQEGENVRVISRFKKKKVDDVVGNPRGETYMHASSNNQLNGYYVAECSHVDYDNDDASSVGSCTVINNTRSRIVGSSHDARRYCSDAESYDVQKEKYPYFIRDGIHSLELHAYHCTLGAFYASGPLSWEQEALLTNLRLSLHISNDEHLTELRKLISGKKKPAFVVGN